MGGCGGEAVGAKEVRGGVGGVVGVGVAVLMVMKREREIVYYYGGTHMNISYVAMTRRREAKQVITWQPHRHSNGQTSLTVRPR